MRMRPLHIALLVSFLMLTIGMCNGGKFKKFHHTKCPQLNMIVRNIIWSKVGNDPTLAAKLLRLHFHDCFVRGCDASILLDSIDGNATEKDAKPSMSVSGYEIIDEVKAKLEEECPSTVSCADILALAARDAVSFQFGRPMWPVFIGRKDGKVSLATEAKRDLPKAASNFTTLKQFARQGLNLVDLVALSGAHTIGVAHCNPAIQRRLYNFTGQGDTDPSLDPAYAKILKQKCTSPPNPSNTVEMDPHSSLSFDSHYFEALNQNQGLFQSDAALLTNPLSKQITMIFEQSQSAFFAQFARSMIRMSAIGVIRGDDGEIRKNCRVVN